LNGLGCITTINDVSYKSLGHLVMKQHLVILLATVALTTLPIGKTSAEQGFYPEKCVIANKPTKCSVNSFGVKKNPKNDIEISYPSGMTGIRLGKSGVKEGGTAIVNNVAGSIQLSHGGEGSASLTIVTRDGKVYSFTYGD